MTSATATLTLTIRRDLSFGTSAESSMPSRPTQRARGVPLDAVYLGGGAFTVPRYVRATRPGSIQTILEIDGDLVDVVEERLDFDRQDDVEIVVGDGRLAVDELDDDSAIPGRRRCLRESSGSISPGNQGVPRRRGTGAATHRNLRCEYHRWPCREVSSS